METTHSDRGSHMRLVCLNSAVAAKPRKSQDAASVGCDWRWSGRLGTANRLVHHGATSTQDVGPHPAGSCGSISSSAMMTWTRLGLVACQTPVTGQSCPVRRNIDMVFLPADVDRTSHSCYPVYTISQGQLCSCDRTHRVSGRAGWRPTVTRPCYGSRWQVLVK